MGKIKDVDKKNSKKLFFFYSTFIILKNLPQILSSHQYSNFCTRNLGYIFHGLHHRTQKKSQKLWTEAESPIFLHHFTSISWHMIEHGTTKTFLFCWNTVLGRFFHILLISYNIAGEKKKKKNPVRSMDNDLYLPRVESATQWFIWIPWNLLDVMNMSELRRLF